MAMVRGYTDLNFLIPELVDDIDYRLGVYHAELGDFGSAGAPASDPSLPGTRVQVALAGHSVGGAIRVVY